MYEKTFGLKTKPFGSNAEGPAVFVGPQQTAVINNLKKGLNAVDSIVAVSGAVGVGKTTLVKRALESLSPGRMVALVGRMSLAPDEVLELLLTGFGISRQATGTIQRFAAFRRLLTERAAAGAQVAIVVEDAQRVGLDAMVELESLTAADSGDATGANIILMGQLELKEWLATPALARLRQRTRLRQVVEPFTAPEVLGYLRHSIRVAGGDFDAIFDAGAVDMLFRCSEGIPRVINNLCESALTMAADEGAGPLTAEFIQKVARDALGIEVFLPHRPVPPIPPTIRTEPDPTFEPAPVQAPEPAPAPKITESIRQPQTSTNTPDSGPVPAIPAGPDIESTQTLKKPAWTDDQPGDVANNDGDELPRELTFEVEQTARMEAINADKIAQAEKEGKITAEGAEPTFKAAPLITVDRNTPLGKQPAAAEPHAADEPDDEDLPMLSQSMRIDAPTPAPPEALLAEARPKPKPLPKPQAAARPAPKPAPGPQTEAKAAPKPAPGPQAEARSAPKPAPGPQAEAKPAPRPAPKPQAEAKPAPKPAPGPQAAARPAPKPEPKSIPLAAVRPPPKAAPEDAKRKLQAPAPAKPPQKPVATANPEARTKADSEAGDKPRMPDIGDLEAAIEAAHREAAGDEPVITHEPATNRPAPVAKPAANKPASAPIPAVQEPATKPAGDKGPDGTAATVTGIPALTLDNALEEKRKEAAKKLDKAAQELGKAESLKDLTDTMAETLFGDASFEAIAADVVANPPPGMTAPGKPKEEASPVMLELEEDQSPVELESGTDCEPAKANKPASPAAGPREMGQTGNFDMTMSKRMDMLKKLNSAAKPAKGATLEKIEIGDDRAAPKTPKPATSQPAPIEQQIKTEITMTVKAISDVDLPPEDDSEDRKGKGLFSRFKRSS